MTTGPGTTHILVLAESSVLGVGIYLPLPLYNAVFKDGSVTQMVKEFGGSLVLYSVGRIGPFSVMALGSPRKGEWCLKTSAQSPFLLWLLLPPPRWVPWETN